MTCTILIRQGEAILPLFGMVVSFGTYMIRDISEVTDIKPGDSAGVVNRQPVQYSDMTQRT